MHERLWKFLVLLALIGGVVGMYGVVTHQFFDGQKVEGFFSTSSTSDGGGNGTAEGSDAAQKVEDSFLFGNSQNKDTESTSTNAFVVKVIDGDTLIARYDGKDVEETIRFLGVNTPETVDPRRPVECFGKEASAFTHTLLEGKRVRLDEDLLADNVDKYHRLLRNIITAQGVDVNAALVREGYAYAYLSFPLSPARKAELKKLENDARMAERGLWSKQACSGSK